MLQAPDSLRSCSQGGRWYILPFLSMQQWPKSTAAASDFSNCLHLQKSQCQKHMQSTYILSMIWRMARTQEHVLLKASNSFVQRWYWNWKTLVTSDKCTCSNLCILLQHGGEQRHKGMVLCHSEVVVLRRAIYALNMRKFSRKRNKWNQIALLSPPYGRRGIPWLSSYRTAELSSTGLLLHMGLDKP